MVEHWLGITAIIGSVLEADCSLLPHIVEHLVDCIDLKQFVRLNEKKDGSIRLFIEMQNETE